MNNCPRDANAIYTRLQYLSPPCWRNERRERAAIAKIVEDPVAGLAALSDSESCWVLARLLGVEERQRWVQVCVDLVSAAYVHSHSHSLYEVRACAKYAAMGSHPSDVTMATIWAIRTADVFWVRGVGYRKVIESGVQLLGWSVP